MKSNIGQKRNQKYKYSCNNWCCPCNDGVKGCYAEEKIMYLCDFDDVGFNKFLDDCYTASLRGEEEYESACRNFYKYADVAYETCPVYYKGYCSELDDGCINPKDCRIRPILLVKH